MITVTKLKNPLEFIYGGYLGEVTLGAGGSKADAGANNSIRAGMIRIVSGIGATFSARDGESPGWQAITHASPNRPIYWLVIFAPQNIDHNFGFSIVKYGAGTRVTLDRTAANVLRLLDFAGNPTNFTTVLAADTLYKCLMTISNGVFSASLYNSTTGALIEKQSCNTGANAEALYRSVFNIGGAAATRYLDFKTLEYKCISG